MQHKVRRPLCAGLTMMSFKITTLEPLLGLEINLEGLSQNLKRKKVQTG